MEEKMEHLKYKKMNQAGRQDTRNQFTMKISTQNFENREMSKSFNKT
jgi:hypothetical protein